LTSVDGRGARHSSRSLCALLSLSLSLSISASLSLNPSTFSSPPCCLTLAYARPLSPTLSTLQLRSIPGVGPYTAAAVASIAFGDAAAAVDGNVIRVLARLRALAGDPSKSHMTSAWDRLAAQLLHPDRPGCHNQVRGGGGGVVLVVSRDAWLWGPPCCCSCIAMHRDLMHTHAAPSHHAAAH